MGTPKLSKKARATTFSIFTAATLAIVKTITGIMIGSLAIIASAADSILDIVSSSVNFYAIRKSEEPPDAEHPFGHGKFESLATFLQSLVIMLSGFYILYKAYYKFTHQLPVTHLDAGIAIMLFSILATFILSKYLKKVAKEENSQVLKADALHYEIDLLTNSGVLISLIIIKYSGLDLIDAIISAIISIYIMIEAIKLAMEASSDLLDSELPSEDIDELKRILDEYDDLHIDYHNLRTRKAGSKKFVDMHLTLCRNLPLVDAHQISDNIEKTIQAQIQDIDVIIHIDACSVKECDTLGKSTNSEDDTCNREKLILESFKNNEIND